MTVIFQCQDCEHSLLDRQGGLLCAKTEKIINGKSKLFEASDMRRDFSLVESCGSHAALFEQRMNAHKIASIRRFRPRSDEKTHLSAKR
jgi:hypothetical protein